MSLTIELTPEEQARLHQTARRAGLKPEAYLRRILTVHVPPTVAAPETYRASPAEIIRDLDDLAESNRDLPVPPPEALERESLYEDRLSCLTSWTPTSWSAAF